MTGGVVSNAESPTWKPARYRGQRIYADSERGEPPRLESTRRMVTAVMGDTIRRPILDRSSLRLCAHRDAWGL